MGTNFYLRYNICHDCGRYDELHIGKRSAGWEFHFQGYEISDFKPPLLNRFDQIRSYETWKDIFEFLGSPNTYTVWGIFDEYGHEHVVKEFDDIVQATAIPVSGKHPINFHDYVLRYHPGSDPGWKDEEGWTFDKGNFS